VAHALVSRKRKQSLRVLPFRATPFALAGSLLEGGLRLCYSSTQVRPEPQKRHEEQGPMASSTPMATPMRVAVLMPLRAISKIHRAAKAILAERSRRKESLVFQVSYKSCKILNRILADIGVRAENFCVSPSGCLSAPVAVSGLRSRWPACNPHLFRCDSDLLCLRYAVPSAYPEDCGAPRLRNLCSGEPGGSDL